MAGLPTPPGASPTRLLTSAMQGDGMGETSRLSAVERLPHELLSDIFLLLRNTPGIKSSISSVCRHWRLVIHRTHQLWSKLVVFPRRALDVNDAVCRLNVLIDRSGSMPLDVDWGSLLRPKAALSAALAACLLERTPVTRWRSLRLGKTGFIPISKISGTFENLRELVVVECSEQAEDFLAVIAASAPTLNLLKLPTAGMAESVESRFMKELVGPDTLLRTAYIHRELTITHIVRKLHISFALYLCGLPQLRELTLDNLTSSDIRLDTFCPNLEMLTVRSCVEKCASISINLPSLRHLVFNGPNYSVLGYIEAPQLQTLQIGKFGFNPTSQISSLSEAMDNPMYQLSPSTLNLECVVDLATIIQLIELSPRVEHLAVSFYRQSDPWRSLFNALLRGRRAHSDNSKFLGWQLCEHLSILQISFHWRQRDVEEARKLGSELLFARSIGDLRRISLNWGDGYTVVVDGAL